MTARERDPEIEAMDLCAAVLSDLEPEAAVRATRWLYEFALCKFEARRRGERPRYEAKP